MAFTTEKILEGSPRYIGALAEHIVTTFSNDGYEAELEELDMGSYEVSLREKGNMFKSIAGMKSALKVTMKPQDGQIYIKAGIGIFGKQALTVAVAALMWWPLLVTQVWALVKQSKLDDRVVEAVELELYRLKKIDDNMYDLDLSETLVRRFCVNCGTELGEGRFCPNCGTEAMIQ